MVLYNYTMKLYKTSIDLLNVYFQIMIYCDDQNEFYHFM